MDLKQRIITYIIKNAPVTMDKLIEVATAKGFTEHEVLTTLSDVHRDKRIMQMADVSGNVMYKLATAKVVTDHLAWVRANYPPMTPNNDGAGIEIDMSWLFLKTKEERDAFKAEMSGRPIYLKKQHEHTRR